MLGGLPEAEHVEHRERHRVLGVAEDLLGPHRADRPGEGREHEDEMVAGEARLDARRVQRGATSWQAASRRRTAAASNPAGYSSPGTEVVTTLTPASSRRQQSSTASVGRDSPDAV